MKRKGFIYDKLIDKQKILIAFNDVKQGKGKRLSIIKFENNLENHVNIIYNCLKNKNYNFRKGKEKIVKEYNKERKINVPFLRDQIVQRLIFNEINEDLINGMYKWSCGSIKGRGGLYAKKYIEPKIKSGKYKYALELDIKKFFHNIDCDILLNQLKEKYKDRYFINLLDNLFKVGSDENNKGLPIGFYSSQILSNFYLNKLDFYIKQELKVKVYVRYVDDMVILHNNKRELNKIKNKIKTFLNKELKLELKGNEQIFPLRKRKVDFVGYKMGIKRTLIRKRNLKLLKRNYNRLRNNKINIYICRVFMNYLSWLKHSKNVSYVRKMKREIEVATSYISKYDKRRNYET